MIRKWTDDDVRFMRRAIELSHNGFPAPNPRVGCVIVNGGDIVGEGWHHAAGFPHAEAMALQSTSNRNGAHVYVTLEPCNHQGRTGPCSEALILNKVARVIYACADPNPKAQGGAERLRESGIRTEQGLLEEEASVVNHQFLFAMRRKRPLVVVKAACSLDGRIALPTGESKWITGETARKEGHRLRVESGAVLVGRRTVEVDDPDLTARIVGVTNQPLRVILDPQKKLSGRERVFNESAETLWVNGAIDLNQLLANLFGRGANGLLIEGGATTIAHFVRQGLVDRYELFLAPKLLGDGPSWLGGLGLPGLASAPSLQILQSQMLGDDLWITAAPQLGHSGIAEQV